MKKILFFGNGAQMNYVIVKYLRKYTQYEPDLLLQDYNHPILDHPAWEDVPVKIPSKIFYTDLGNALKIFNQTIEEKRWSMADWIKEKKIQYSITDKFITKYIDKSHTIKKQIKHYVNDLKKYDFVISDGFGAISAFLARKPYVIRPFGSDIDINAFDNDYRGSMIRIALKQARAIFAHAYTENLKKLGVDAKRYEISVIIDSEKLKPEITSKNPIPEFFLASRLDFKDKGTDKVFRAFAKLLKTFNAHLFCLEYGTDIQKTHDLINSLGLQKNVTFYDFVASKPVLNQLFNKHDAIIGNLNYGTVGTTELEALSCNKPVIAYVKPQTRIETKLPIMNSFSENEIYENMKNVIENRNLPTGMRNFILENFGINSFLKNFKEVLHSNGVDPCF